MIVTVNGLLAACRARVRDVAVLRDQLDDLEDNMTRLGGGGLTGVAVQHSLGDAFAAYVGRRDDVSRRLMDAQRRLAAEQTAVILLTDDLPREKRELLRSYYCYRAGVTKLSEELHCTISNVYKRLTAAREALAGVTEEDVESKLPGWYTKGGMDDA